MRQLTATYFHPNWEAVRSLSHVWPRSRIRRTLHLHCRMAGVWIKLLPDKTKGWYFSISNPFKKWLKKISSKFSSKTCSSQLTQKDIAKKRITCAKELSTLRHMWANILALTNDQDTGYRMRWSQRRLPVSFQSICTVSSELRKLKHRRQRSPP